MKRTMLVAMVVCAVFFITVISSFAQVIYGCVKNSGDLQIVSGPGQCKSNQTPISWPAGVGVVNAVHGVVLEDGSVESGEGFTPSHIGTGLYTVTFTQAFSSNAHCVITPFQSPATVICAVFGYGTTFVDVNCYAPGVESGGLFTNIATDVSFSFICVE